MMKLRHCMLVLACFIFIGLTTTACSQEPEKPALKVLFIGNSYTFANDMPDILASLVNNAAENDFRLETAMVAPGGYDFKRHWESDAALQKIKSQKWHYVILQNQSGWATETARTKEAYRYGKMFADEIRKHGAAVAILETWARHPSSADYKKFHWFKNYDYMHKILHQSTHQVARYIGADVIDINYYWDQIYKNNSDINLYTSDGSHPSAAGSTLAALTIYKFITGKPAQYIPTLPKGLNKADARSLLLIVAQNPH